MIMCGSVSSEKLCIPSFWFYQVSDFILKKGGEHEDRLEKAQEDACVYNEEKDAELP